MIWYTFHIVICVVVYRQHFDVDGQLPGGTASQRCMYPRLQIVNRNVPTMGILVTAINILDNAVSRI